MTALASHSLAGGDERLGGAARRSDSKRLGAEVRDQRGPTTSAAPGLRAPPDKVWQPKRSS